jgi:hypothetical protein
MDFYQSSLGQFLASSTGRVVRVIAGIVLIVWGYMLLTSVAGFVLVIIGLVPLLAGLFDVCVISALLGGPFQGTAIRKAGRK